MKRRPVAAIMFLVALSGCTNNEVRKFMGYGMKTYPYQEPTSGDTASLTINAPYLRGRLGFEDRIHVTFYDSCTDKYRSREEGYIGSLELSSDPEVGHTKTVEIPVDQKLFFEVGYSQTSYHCTNKFMITPVKDENYQIDWVYSGGECGVSASRRESDNKLVETADIVYLKNEGNFWNGASGRTTSEWRSCTP